MKLLHIALAAVLCLWAASAQANPAATDAPKVDKFELMDTNKDGKVSYEEFKAYFPNMREEAFAVIDKNGDKAINRAEWDEFVSNHSSGHMGGSMGNMMGGQGGMPGNAMMPTPGSADMPLVTPPNGK
ncbi:EF-hand domain-containing protein [Desulfovibrio desulfuricans]|uniref:EF-hand domain-containing protein n=1 Tax=Desulfovibrio desulfuricans TaxID=876 RepID=UPI001AE5C343|nr:EF-hand domain-containing protein [Desulfovibrio desulfuricans]MDD3684466.1 EF-hand domain-containing protein [Desulfovibrio desulfuricans]QTO40137.1 EF-hand domain-containing protein [Desulfovibrio desulfuricans]